MVLIFHLDKKSLLLQNIIEVLIVSLGNYIVLKVKKVKMTKNLKHSSFLAAVCLLLFCSSAPLTAARHNKTNVVLILIDDLGWKDVGCYGSTYYQTPHIDRLASGGMRFTDGYAACNVCSPTRAAIMTGKYPARLLLTQ